MKHPACRRRVPKLPPLPLHFHAVGLPNGVMFGVDLGHALATLDLRELLKEAGLRGSV